MNFEKCFDVKLLKKHKEMPIRLNLHKHSIPIVIIIIRKWEKGKYFFSFKVMQMTQLSKYFSLEGMVKKTQKQLKKISRIQKTKGFCFSVTARHKKILNIEKNIKAIWLPYVQHIHKSKDWGERRRGCEDGRVSSNGLCASFLPLNAQVPHHRLT